MTEKKTMLEKFKYLCMAVGVCFPIYFTIYGIYYVLEILWLPERHWIAGPTLLGVSIVLALRVAYMFARAAVDGGPVLRVRPDPVVVAPTLAIGAPFGPDPEPSAGVEAPPAPVAQAEPAEEREPRAGGRLVPGAQHG